VKILHLTTAAFWAVMLYSSAQQILIAAIGVEDDQQFQDCFANRAVIVYFKLQGSLSAKELAEAHYANN
jgi:hypothetical protein